MLTSFFFCLPCLSVNIISITPITTITIPTSKRYLEGIDFKRIILDFVFSAESKTVINPNPAKT